MDHKIFIRKIVQDIIIVVNKAIHHIA